MTVTMLTVTILSTFVTNRRMPHQVTIQRRGPRVEPHPRRIHESDQRELDDCRNREQPPQSVMFLTHVAQRAGHDPCILDGICDLAPP